MIFLMEIAHLKADETTARSIFYKKTVSDPDKLAARFTLLLKKGSEFREVSLNHEFHSGDEFRFIIRPNRTAYIYVMNINPKGKISYVWPTKDELQQTDNRIYRGQDNYIVPDGLFYFDKDTGEEWLMTILAPKQFTPQLSLLKKDFEKYKTTSGQVYEYAYNKKTNEIPMYGPRGQAGITSPPLGNDAGTYAALKGSGEKNLVLLYRLTHSK